MIRLFSYNTLKWGLFLGISSFFLIKAFSQQKSVDIRLYVLDEEDQNIKRKFLPHMVKISDSSYFICWELGAEEINNNTIQCRIYKNNFKDFDQVEFPKPQINKRYFPVGIINIEEVIYLYFMEMDIGVYNGHGKSTMKRAKFDRSTESLMFENKEIWITTLGVAMQVITQENKFIVPVYERDVQKDGTFFSSIRLLELNKRGNKVLNVTTVQNNDSLKLFEPSIAFHGADSSVLILRTHERKNIHITSSADGAKNWSIIKETEINSPGSMSRVFHQDNYYFVIHNNINSDENGARNSLDLTVIDSKSLTKLSTFNLIHDANDFFSNFSVLVEDSTVFIPYQRLIRSKKYNAAPDRVELISFNINEIIRQLK